jgi:hypothetical protein
MDNVKEVIITSNNGMVDLTTDLNLLWGLINFAIENGYLDDLENKEYEEALAILDILEKEM